MMSKTKKEMLYIWLAVGLFISSTIQALITYYILSPVPYKGVSALSITEARGVIEFKANFEKTDCVFANLTPVAFVAGERPPLKWVNNDIDVGDRLQGYHTLSIAIFTEHLPYDKIEIRTRHLCDSKKTDRVFYTIYPEDVNKEKYNG